MEIDKNKVEVGDIVFYRDSWPQLIEEINGKRWASSIVVDDVLYGDDDWEDLEDFLDSEEPIYFLCKYKDAEQFRRKIEELISISEEDNES